MTSPPAHCTAFQGMTRIASGPAGVVALAVKAALRENPEAVLIFDDRSGRQVDFDLRGTDDAVLARLAAEEGAPAAPERPGRGRPRLGVVAREVTLLPRHWDWLSAQPGGASVALRRLVEAARTHPREQARAAQAAADRFISVMAGNLPGYEEAARALYAGDAGRFRALSEAWPADPRDHARHLAAPAFAQPDAAGS